MDKITNNTFNNMQKHISKNRENLGNVVKSASTIKSESKINLVDLKDTKVIATTLAKSAPIDADKVTKIKVEEVVKMLPTLDKTSKIKDDDLTNLLQYYDLIQELKNVQVQA